MGQEQNSKWYDNAFKADPLYSRHYRNTHYFSLWSEIIKDVQPKWFSKIIDLGCGVGQFAHMLYDLGYKYYTGYDFSEYAIKEARKKCPDYQRSHSMG